ncbi:hypothetical protein FRC98_06875 [Lujinxingia vulgaris]|uniref:Uncharacterized protein n=1 Tax=Lujinxingia vulgaris TaxID=2600176 RepID=A0A5C6XFM1_9DELT|nr:hypothetical protein [Lujinxingia vulgaris]TXD38599.1 hypothetical protein FRC98_06875 [Lujinxingia vulgaris]
MATRLYARISGISGIALAIGLLAACSSAPPPSSEAAPALSPAEDHEAELQSLLQEADASWKERRSGESLERALRAYDGALTLDAEHDLVDDTALLDLQLSRAQAYAFAARAALAGSDEAPQDATGAARKGEEAARAALLLDENSNEARYWLARNLELGARAAGAAAKLERAPELNTLFDALAANAPERLRAESALMLAGRACSADFGRDLEACAAHIDAAEQAAPDDLDVALARASLLAVATNDRAAFERHLSSLVALKPDGLSPEAQLARLEARALLEQIDRYFAPTSP